MGNGQRLTNDLLKHEKVGIDSAILIYHLEDLAPYSELTERVFSLLAEGKFTAILSTITVTELLTKPFIEGKQKAIQACDRFLEELPHTLIVPPSYSVARMAAQLRGRYGLRTPDALMLGTALDQGATAFLSNDAALRKAKPEGIDILLLDAYAKE